MLELSVPVDMMAAFQALAVDLTAIAETIEQLGDPARRDAMPHVAQRQRELRMALGHPHQRPHRVAERRRFQQAAAGLPTAWDRLCVSAGRPPPERRTFDGAGTERRQILQATIDRAARHSGRPRHDAHAAISGRTRLRRRKQPPFPLVEARRASLRKRLRIAVSSIMPP